MSEFGRGIHGIVDYDGGTKLLEGTSMEDWVMDFFFFVIYKQEQVHHPIYFLTLSCCTFWCKGYWRCRDARGPGARWSNCKNYDVS
jgi:hypothetical protein